jgi:hypothetical protein
MLESTGHLLVSGHKSDSPRDRFWAKVGAILKKSVN